MKKASTLFVSLLCLFAGFALSLNAEDEKETVIEVLEKAPEQPKSPVKKTEEEWKKELTPEQFRILRQAGTERSNGQVYKEFKAQGGGTYYCAGCNAELFSSKEKFDSHCGWPSFYDPANAKNVKYETDFHLGYARTEVRCMVCDGHLGHVFEGEGFDTPTDKRYCINGTVLKFVPFKDGEKATKKETGKAEKKEKADS
tara:strand:+ start:383 stop:979 length:597 start_codon:yes stop_codon:yes gene_type:complete